MRERKEEGIQGRGMRETKAQSKEAPETEESGIFLQQSIRSRKRKDGKGPWPAMETGKFLSRDRQCLKGEIFADSLHVESPP